MHRRVIAGLLVGAWGVALSFFAANFSLAGWPLAVVAVSWGAYYAWRPLSWPAAWAQLAATWAGAITLLWNDAATLQTLRAAVLVALWFWFFWMVPAGVLSYYAKRARGVPKTTRHE